MLGKIMNGSLITPSEKEREKVIVTRPTDEMLKYIRGYKDVTETEPPEYDPETQYLEPVYTETETTITVSWEVKEMETTIDEEMLQEEAQGVDQSAE